MTAIWRGEFDVVSSGSAEDGECMKPVLGILCGMEDEARVLGALRHDPRVIVRISAGRAERARTYAREMFELGVKGIVSWGVCGGLDPELRSGDVVICSPGEVLASEIVLSSSQQKLDGRAGGYRIVDLESGAVARAAVDGIAVRVVLDEAEFDLPAPALVPLRADGRPDLPRILWKLLVSPTSLPAMVGLARRHKAALVALSECTGQIVDLLETLSLASEDRTP